MENTDSSTLQTPLDVEDGKAEEGRIVRSPSGGSGYDRRAPASIPFEDENAASANSCCGGWFSFLDLGFTHLAGKIGTYTGFALLVSTMIVSVYLQVYSPESEDVQNIWLNNCQVGFDKSCLANQAVLRFACALVVLYGLNFVLTLAAAYLYDQYWWLKIPFFVGICSLFVYLDASNFDNDGFAWFARVGGFLYIMLQQVILLDFALTWNETWVDNSNKERSLIIGYNRWDRWQIGIIGIGFGLLILSIIFLSIMLKVFGGCTANDFILSMGIVITIVGLIIQLFYTKIGSVLTSGVMGAYYAYICFSAVTLNPDRTCNPTLAQSPQTWTTILGLLISVISLSYTCWKTIKLLPGQILIGHTDDANAYATEGLRMIFIYVSLIFILGTCYYSMVLTNWATLQSDFQMGNSQVGSEAMWLQGSASWICFLMYIWAILAPMIWPEKFGYDPKRLHGR